MEYYSSAEKRPQDYRKTIDLNNCEDMVAPLPVHSRQFVIKLSVKNQAKMRDYYFDCGSEPDMDCWVQCLAAVCGFSASKSIYSLVCPCCSYCAVGDGYYINPLLIDVDILVLSPKALAWLGED